MKKDKTTAPPKYIVFFKGRDADVITQAFKEYVKANEKKQNRVSVKEKLAAFREILAKGKIGNVQGNTRKTGGSHYEQYRQRDCRRYEIRN